MASIIGFHYSTGGAKQGTGDWIANANGKGIPVGLKGVDDAGLCFEGQETGQAHGVSNWLVYRVSTAGQDNGIEYDVPDYLKSPQAAAQEHFDKTAAKWPPELDKAVVWMEPINEPRGKYTGEPMWNNLHPVDWLGYFMYEYAVIANANGFKVCGPSFNSGEPGDEDSEGNPLPLSDVVKQYSRPGMLKYLAYCAANPDKAALALHEYIWHYEPPQYPQLWGRFEAAIAAADNAGIPRTFPIFVTEWGYSPSNAPSYPAVTPDLDAYNNICARFPQVKFAAAWTLQSGYDPVDDQVITWVDYPIDKQFDEGPQPAVTHAAFGGTLPSDTGEPTMQTYSFESDNWTVLSDRLQQPENMILTVIQPGQPLWYPGGDTGGKATGTVEALHKGCNFVPPNLPPHQCAGGSDPLVLDYFRCYKIQAVDMASGTSLKHTFPGTGRKRVTIPVNVHWHVDQPNEVDDVIVGVLLNGVEIKRLQHPELKDRTWHYVTGEADGPVTVELRFQTSYRNRRDCFTDKWDCEDLEPMTWEQQAWEMGIQKKVLGFRTGAALQVQITADGYQALSNEYEFIRFTDGVTLVCQRAKHVTAGTFRTYYVIPPNYDTIYILEDPAVSTPAPFEFAAYPVPEQAYFITSPFNAGRPSYPPTTNQLHEGVDLRAPFGTPIAAVADGVVDGLRVDPGYGYGTYVRIKHNDRYLTWYGHLKNYIVQLGQVIQAGQIIGYADSTGAVWPQPTPTNPTAGTHLHLTLVDLEQGLDGYIVSKVTNPKPFLDALQTPAGIDLRRFMIADPAAFRVVRMPDGRQEEIQDMQLGGGLFVRRKNDLGEWWKADGQYFYLVHDTSPDTGGAGIERVYTLTKGSLLGAPKNPLFMTVGQSWQETGTHYVQFRAKNGCGLLSENSGFAQNTAVLVDHQTNVVFNEYGQNLAIDEVVWIKTGTEMQIYGRHNGKAVGWCGWQSPWGKSEIVELYWNRAPMTEEPNRYCSW